MRRREFGVRLALGASRGRLVRQLITESLLLASFGAASGWLFTVWGLPILAVATNVPETADVSPDVRVYAFLVGIAALAGVGVGLVPAFQGTSGSLASSVNSDDLRAGVSPRPRRIRKVLTAVQAALCVVLLVSAALLVKSVIRVTSVELGFDAQRLVVVSPDLPSHGYDAARAAVFFDSAVDRLRAVPGVSGVSVVLNPPLGGRNWTGLTVRDGQTIRVNINRATPDYFATAGMPLVLGRTLGPGDDASHGVVVSENLARLVQGDGSPIGAPLSRVTHLFPSEVIVGVVADTRSANARDGAAWYVYHPMTSKDRVESSIVIRAAGDPRPVVPAIAAAIRAVDPNLRVEAQLVSASFRHELEDMRAFATVASVIGGLAFLLAVTGIYGITAFLVSERTREIGLRLAIGATTAQVMRRLIRDGLRPVVIGLACGAVAAFGAGQALAGALATSPTDPASFSIGIGALAAAALAAIVVPARRVLRIDPATVLRSGG
jgi:predicted permease